ncbi:MAG TPA: glycosyltransferase family 2 protein [Streptosporangiaceae bacterium]|jgi:cellulose synthase/poly-beta-1,6-N-acetylglucosamine synthase-like glycosyltransferase
MMPWWGVALLVFGANFTLWGSVGLLRLADQAARSLGRMLSRRPARAAGNVVALRHHPAGRRARQVNLTVDDVAVLIPAHNESAVIEDSLDAITKLVPRKNIHVVSDGSTDDTLERAMGAGVKAIKTRRNVGKAGALAEAVERFKLVERFPVVMLLDADTRVQPGYFAAALPLFDSPKVVAVAGCVRTDTHRVLSPLGNMLTGHRMRIYAVGQRVLKFGQTSRFLNATPIVPGFASIYRTAVLPRMEMNPPGLVIEDFNMTFEVYQRRLGHVGFTLGAVAVTQDPDNLHDYIRQTRRWALGLWQTVRRHPPRLNLFTAMLALSLTELVTSCLLFITLPPLIAVLMLPHISSATLTMPVLGPVYAAVSAHVTLPRILYGVGVPDFAMTCLVTLAERRPRLLLSAVFFPFMRVLDAFIGLQAIPLAWLASSNGVWKSPARRRARRGAALPAQPAAAAAAWKQAERQASG